MIVSTKSRKLSVLKQFHHGLFPKRAINVNCHHFSNILIVWDRILFTLKIDFPTIAFCVSQKKHST